MDKITDLARKLQPFITEMVESSAAWLSHHTRHESGGLDAIKLDDLAAAENNTDLDASVTAHGLLPKLSGDWHEALRGTGAWIEVFEDPTTTAGDMIMRGSVATDWACQAQGGSASADSFYLGYYPAYANDSDDGSAWCGSGTQTGHWLEITLAAAKDIGRYRLYQENAAAYKIQYYEGGAWVDHYTHTITANDETVTMPTSHTAQKWRILCTADGLYMMGWWIYSFELYSTNPPVVRLGVGSAGQVLGVAAGVPAWQSTATPAAHHLTHEAGGSDKVTVAWGDVSGPPATYPPSAHNHGTGTNDRLVQWNGTGGLLEDSKLAVTASDVVTLAGALTAPRTLTVPDASITLAGINLAQTFTKAQVIQPDSDAVALTVKGNAAQSVNVLEGQTSAGTKLLQIGADWHLAIGGIAPSVTTWLSIQPTVTTMAASENYGVSIYPFWRPADSSYAAKNYMGIICDMNPDDTNVGANMTGTYYGGRFRVVTRNASYTLSNVVGGWFGFYTNGRSSAYGNITNAYGGRFGGIHNGGTITNLYGARIDAPTLAGSAAVTNHYGLYIEDVNKGGTANYAIYTGAGAVRLGDTLTVVGGLGCNGKAAQAAYASGGAVTDTATSGGYGFTDDAHFNGMMTLLGNIRAALVANGIMS